MRINQRTAWIAAVVGALWLSFAPQARGQAAEDAGYESMEIAEDYQMPSEEGVNRGDRQAMAQLGEQKRNIVRKLRDTQSSISDYLRGRSSNATASEVEAWFNGFVIPMMAQTDSESLSNLGEFRERFFRLYVNDAGNANLRGRVRDLVAPAMKQIAEGNYHPAARVNAIYVLGRLNDREGVRETRTVPVPNNDALNYLIDTVRSDTLPAYLKAAALAGIERHAAVRGPKSPNAFSEAEARRVGDTMLDTLTLEASPPELQDDLVYWIKRRAIRILGLVGVPGDNGGYAKALRDVIADDEQKMIVRSDAVEAYGQLDFSDDPDLAELLPVTRSIGQLVAQAATDDAQYIDDKISEIKMTAMFLDGTQAQSSGGGGANRGRERRDAGLGQGAEGGGQRGPGSRTDEVPEVLPDYQREQVRRRFKAYAWSGRIGLVGTQRDKKGGLRQFAEDDDPAAELIDELVKDIERLMTATDVRREEEEEEDDEDGLRNRDDDDEVVDEGPKIPLADQLKIALEEGAKKIQDTLDRMVAPAQEDASGDPQAPAEAQNGQ